MPKLEKDIESEVSEYAEKLGFLVLKLNVLGQVGWPDRLFIGSGRRIFFIEFKKPGEKPRVIQQYFIDRIRAFGFDVQVVDNVQQGRAVVEGHSQGHPVV